jgi:hypothetical protein
MMIEIRPNWLENVSVVLVRYEFRVLRDMEDIVSAVAACLAYPILVHIVIWHEIRG